MRAAASLLPLQKTLGNRYVQRLLSSARAADNPSDELIALPPIQFVRQPTHVSLDGGCDGLRLHGKTDTDFNSSGNLTKQVAKAGKNCNCDPGDQCIHVTGVLVTDYSVNVTITMPPMPSGLTDCEQAKVQNFLDHVLQPHEEDHRRRFQIYNGQTKNAVDVSGCSQDDIAQKVQAIGDAEDARRQASANANSALIDPFTRPIDCSDCDKKTAPSPPGPTTGPTK